MRCQIDPAPASRTATRWRGSGGLDEDIAPPVTHILLGAGEPGDMPGRIARRRTILAAMTYTGRAPARLGGAADRLGERGGPPLDTPACRHGRMGGSLALVAHARRWAKTFGRGRQVTGSRRIRAGSRSAGRD